MIAGKERKEIDRWGHDARKKQLLDIAIELAADVGYQNVSRKMIADRANVVKSLVSAYFGSMPKLRETIMRSAIKNSNLKIIAQGLIAKDKIALTAPKELKLRATVSLLI